MLRLIIIVAVSVAMSLAGSPCLAQASNSSRNTYGGAIRSARSRVLNRPTVSPYLRLLQNGGVSSGGFGDVNPIYQTQVRPAIENRQQSMQQQRQIQQIQGSLNQVRQQFRQSNSGLMSTGHPTRYMSYSHYYPSLGR